MKIIDLLNKIANGEIPIKIKYKNKIYIYQEDEQDYAYIEDGYYNWLLSDGTDMSFLNEEVELIEDETIDIEEIKHEELEILQEILGKCDLWKGNEEYILKVINENNTRLLKAILKVSKENETLTKALKQLNKEIKSIKEK